MKKWANEHGFDLLFGTALSLIGIAATGQHYGLWGNLGVKRFVATALGLALASVYFIIRNTAVLIRQMMHRR